MNSMQTKHKIHIGKAQDMSLIDNVSVDLVVTSPPYPMIEMWDHILSSQNPKIAEALNRKEGNQAFELMHQELDKVWNEINRVLIPGGIVCVNIGDATRTIEGNFAIYSNHSRIINYFTRQGFSNLPNIIWRKQTNAPNKFMGSGMLPAGAYVTLEHEWILIFRKGGKREFKSVSEKQARRESSFFWEERNLWFSDLWDNIKGTKQKIANAESRERSAAYPFELPYRLINMYSLQGDTVLDPFLGTGTTTMAAMASNRNSIGYEIDSKFADLIIENINSLSARQMNMLIDNRIEAHKQFVENRSKDKEVKHFSNHFNLPVMTAQETDMKFSYLSDITIEDNQIDVFYSDILPSSSIISDKRVNRFIETERQTVLPF